MGATFSSPHLTVAYAHPTEDLANEGEERPRHDQALSTWSHLLARRTAPHRLHQPTACGDESPALPVPYAGPCEILRDFVILNPDDMDSGGNRTVQLRRRARRLQPVRVKETKGAVALRAQGIVTLTPSIGGLFLVTQVDVSDNLLTFVPDSIGDLDMLERLNLANNQLSSLPAAIGKLRRLRYINLERNRLRDLPQSFERLKKLRRVQMGHNLFDRIPECITRLPKLIHLCVNNNYSLRWLPGRLAQSPRLHFIEAMGCDLFTNYSAALIDHCSRQSSTPHSASLLELCLRELLLCCEQVPEHLLDTVRRSVKMCDFCNGPFFWHSITRARLIRNQSEILCMVYRMCKVHWNDDASRVRALFRNDLDAEHDTQWMDAYKQEYVAETTKVYTFVIV